MDSTLESNPLSEHQQGFRRCRSTETAISNTINFIETCKQNKEHCIAVFLDIAAAFDTIKPKHIKQQLRLKGIEEEIVQWYYNYITERYLSLVANDNTLTTCVDTGFPQGGVCSAKFWIIAFDPAIDIINSNRIFGQGFADDCAALIGGTDLEAMSQQLNETLLALTTWGNTCGLRFNANKTIMLHFKCNNKRTHQQPTIQMGGSEIAPSKHTRYLGVEIDGELKWDIHITTKIYKCRNLLATLSGHVKHNYGPKPKLVKWVYSGIIRPKLLYACQAWANKVTPKQIKSMKRLDRLTTTASAPIRHSTPQATLEILFDLTPIDLLIQQLGTSSYLRTKPHIQIHEVAPNGHLQH